MPPFYERLRESELADIASYVRTAWGNAFGTISEKQVAAQWWRSDGDRADLYERVCARCHGSDGGGFIGPPFVSNPNLASAPYVVTKILRGGGGMPSFDGLLNEEQVAALATYIRATWGNTYSPVNVDAVTQAQRQTGQQGQAQQGQTQTDQQVAGQGGPELASGATLYEANCVVCHGSRGTGGVAPALAGNSRLQDARYVVSRIVMGGGGMPSFNEVLSSVDIAAVASYIRTRWGNAFGPVSLTQTQNLHGGNVTQAPQQSQDWQQQEQDQRGGQPQENAPTDNGEQGP